MKLTQTILEQIQLVGLAPDTERGIIPGVRVQGMVSRNGYRYSQEAMQRALPLFEGVKVFWNHSTDFKLRNPDDFFGRITNVRLEADGIRGDLKYIKSHPKSTYFLEVVQEAAERTVADKTPWNGSLGLSPHLLCGPTKADKRGKYIDHIESVLSVDIVAYPGTTLTIQESLVMPITWKQYAESLDTEAARPGMVRILESLGVATEETVKPADDSAEAMLLAGAEKLCATGKPADEKKATAVMESYLGIEPEDESEELAQAKLEKQVLRECLDADYKPSEVMLKTLHLTTDANDRKQLIQEAMQGKTRLPRGPRSQGTTAPAAKKNTRKEEFDDLDTMLVN